MRNKIEMKTGTLSEIGNALGNAPAHLGIGIFDGFHRGHAEIFSRAKNAALADGGICGALTFDPHPEVFFRGADALRLIYPLAVRLELFANAGLDFAVKEPFTRELASVPAEKFLAFLKEKIPSLKSVYVGENFRFGSRRGGNAEMLFELGNVLGISVNAVSPVKFSGEKISSTRIRAALESGEIAAANAMLSRNYFCAGEVIPGRQLGRTIGFPTLNIAWQPERLPRFGVYEVRLTFPRAGEVFRGIANYGVRPTVELGNVPAPLLEVHLLDFPAVATLPTNGDFVSVEWIRFIRPERRFPSIDALRAQLAEDVSVISKK